MSRFFQEIELVAQRGLTPKQSSQRQDISIQHARTALGFYHQNLVFQLSRHHSLSKNSVRKSRMFVSILAPAETFGAGNLTNPGNRDG